MKINFKHLFKGKVVIVGIGHPLRGDDALGPSLVKRLDGHLDALCIDAGSAPENYLGKIIKASPDVILFIDAVDFNKEPGFYKILEQEEILKTGFTTHDLSPKMLIEYLSTETKAKMYLLGIQPKDLELGGQISLPVQEALGELERLLRIESIIKGILEHTQKESAQSVLKVHLKVGFLTGFKEESFKETFRMLAQGTLLEKARLELTFFPGTRVEVISFDIE